MKYGRDLEPDIEFTVDPGTLYSVLTPSGVTLTKLRPAAAHGSSAFIDFVTKSYSEKARPGRPYRRQNL